ncbi:hypothetical protein HDV00_000122 [Rhizophlyctis rosea]|nr:hypothetical protein HDV00_000122 [Rhizophlyctis rosea]
MPRGILKSSSQHEQDDHHKGIKWDEDNIMLTEAGKGHTMKITEPKTPYIHYDHENDVVLGGSSSIPPLELSAALEAVPPPSRTSSSGSLFGDKPHVTVHQPPESKAHGDWESDDEEEEERDPEEEEKHRRFAALRAEHYQMKEALKKGRQLAGKTAVHADNDEEEEDEEEDDDDDMDADKREEADTQNGSPAEDEEVFALDAPSSNTHSVSTTETIRLNGHKPAPHRGLDKMDFS